ncbi:hypothetical protein UPYG_G00341580 [Umbra pygmaea]|uniref:Cyclin-dependent kinases regulatory subunit n=2 Tax=Esociformes TaxID=8007 RepID=A0ABD0VXU8_UMBPY
MCVMDKKLCTIDLMKYRSQFFGTSHVKKVVIMSQKQIYYSDKYDDEKFEYRHVMLPKDIAKRVPKTHLMSETEWRNLGVQQSQGWVHYMIHQPEPHILLFRRPLPAA